MIAVSVLSATVFSSFSGFPALMLAMKSVCSCTYGRLSCAVKRHARGPVMSYLLLSASVWQEPLSPTSASETFFSHPSICRHMLISRVPFAYS